MITGMIAHLDKLALKTLFGRVESWTKTKEDKKPTKQFMKKIKKAIGEGTRDNIQYLKGKANLPIYEALRGLKGI